jgi:hypothetical protein
LWKWYMQLVHVEICFPYCLHCQNFYQVVGRGAGFRNSAA